jgi:hypothetical protein
LYETPLEYLYIRKTYKEATCAKIAPVPKSFAKDRSLISRHLTKEFKAGELDESATAAQIPTVQREE